MKSHNVSRSKGYVVLPGSRTRSRSRSHASSARASTAFFHTEQIAGIVLSVMFFSIFVIVFFFTYVVHIEQTIVRVELSELVGRILGVVGPITSLPKSDLSGVVSLLESENNDAPVLRQNQRIRRKAIGFSLGFISLCCGLVALLYWKHPFSLSRVVLRSLGMLVFIALTETFFLNLITRNYQNIDTNELGRYVVANILKVPPPPPPTENPWQT